MKAEIIRTNRKSVSLQVLNDGRIVIRAPLGYAERDAERLLDKHEAWIIKAKERQKNKMAYPVDEKEILMLKKRAAEILPAKVAKYASIMGLTPKSVKIGRARGRFGSCSYNGNLNFSCFLMLYPEEAIDYVVVHELAHLKCRGHDKRFYALVARYMPDYKEREKLLKK
jgi:predicted metal-dependent hydrolase